MPKGLRFYRQAKHSQRIAVTNGSPTNTAYHVNRNDHWGNSEPALNPNRLFPWAASGGLHESTGWTSYTGVALPGPIKAWTAPVDVANGGVIPGGKHWRFCDGTVFIDMLVMGTAPFEIRQRVRHNDGWASSVIYRGADRPANYTGPRKACIDCHTHAGSSKQYGILIRGNDGCFSAPILREGSVEFDYANWPLER